MNILYIVPQLNFGGVETHSIDLALGMKERGHSVLFISNGGKLVEKLTKNNIEHKTLPVHKKSLTSIFFLTKVVREIIKKRRIDIVHSHSRVPAWIGYFSSRRNAHFITTAHALYKPHLGSKAMAMGEKIIAVSNNVKEHLIKNFNVCNERIEVIYNGIKPYSEIEIEELKIKNKNLKNQLKTLEADLIIGSVGRLTKLKGYDILIKAFELLKQEGKTSKKVNEHQTTQISKVDQKDFGLPTVEHSYNMKLVIIGEGKERENLNNLAILLNLKDDVTFMGYKENAKEIIGLFDIYVQPSLKEGFSLSILEAMNWSLPVIVSDAGGMKEVIETGITGFVFKSGNHFDLAAKMKSLIESNELRNKMGNRGKKRLLEKFTLSHMIEQTEKVYLELIKK